jgi:enoyl-CoA hydratase/carnithine racemase
VSEIIIRCEWDGAVRTITLNRPDKRNALSREMFDVLIDAFETEPALTDRVTVLRAEGTVFCAGVDLGQRADNPSAAGQSPLERLCDAIRRYPLPVGAVVQGHAIGGGMMLALHCDFVVAAEEARLGNTAVQLGLVPAWEPARRVVEAIGVTLARELLLLGDPVPAGRLAAAHAIADVVPTDGLNAAADAVVSRLVANAPLSLRAVKATLNAGAYVEAEHPVADDAIARAQVSEDAVEGVAARKEKRTPQFAGR